jgi:hypothetical protein
MKNEKSPESDGLPAEFYKHFFHIFGYYFVQMINDVFKSMRCLSYSMRMSYITPLCKKPEQPFLLSNWRPISLLNTDYKIISRALVSRVRKIIKQIINTSQTSVVPMADQ